MAERRMFAKTIIDSDAFLDMPLSAQALYFHLSMRADDEGFINNHKKIQRMIGASDDDFKVLLAKNFVIVFESGVIVIKHWKIHNYIRNDRLVKTNYEEERSLLEVKDNGSYTILKELEEVEDLTAKDKRKLAYKESSLPYSFDYKIKRAFENKICPVCGKKMTSSYKLSLPTVQHNIPISKGGKHEIDNISIICESCNTSIQDKETDSLNNEQVIETWDKIIEAEKQNIKWFWEPTLLETVKCLSSDGQVTGKCQHRLGKDSIDKNSIDNNISSKKYEIDYQEVINYYHHFCPSLPKVTKITEARKKLINARLKDYSVDEVKTAFKLAEESDFLTGRSGKWGGANFDWIMNTNNIVKILEGNYRNKEGAKTGVELYRETKKGNYDFEALEYESKHRWESEKEHENRTNRC